MSTTPVERLTAELNKQFRSFLDRMDKLRKPLDFARNHYYLTQEAEPVLELLKPGIAWVAQGRYGPTLISRNLPIWDVDKPAAPPTEQEAAVTEWHVALLAVMQESGHSFRLYQTRGGMRVICTNRTVDLNNEVDAGWFREIGAAIQADRAYMVISSRQKCSRARLRPKPPELRWNESKALRELVDRGLTRACRYWRTIGTAEIHSNLAEQIAFHDAETEALDSDKELF